MLEVPVGRERRAVDLGAMVSRTAAKMVVEGRRRKVEVMASPRPGRWLEFVGAGGIPLFAPVMR